MIKINLLGEEGSGSADNMMWLAAYVGSIVVLFLVFIGLSVYISFEISDMTDQVQVAEGKLSSLREKTKEVSDLEKKKTELQNMTIAIATLKKSQEGPVKLLSDLNSALPDRLWLTSATLKGDKMRLEGLALNDESIVGFTQNLKQSPYFSEVRIVDRVTSYLAQINTYSALDGNQARIITRAEKEVLAAKLNELKLYAESRGLTYSNNPPDATVNPDNNSIETGGSQTVTKLSFEGASANSPTPKIKSRRPMFFAWENLQHVQGQSFIVESKMSYTPKSLNLDLLTPTASAAQPTPAKSVAKAAAKTREVE